MWFIFRRSDGVLLYFGNRDGQLYNELDACERNEGLRPDEFVILQHPGPIPFGMLAEITPQETVHFVPNPLHVAREQLAESAKAKLIALGLTVAEADLAV